MATDTDGTKDASAPTSTAACFAAGTLIRIARDRRIESVAVEALAVGDRVLTVSGALRPIRWLGHRVIDCATYPVPTDVWPVRVRAGALGVDLPERDLYLSPGHPVLIGQGDDEVLVPIMCLINGTSIERRQVETVTYWHVELDKHDILLAEGLGAESFLDYSNRPWFEKSIDDALTTPDLVGRGRAARCRPVALDGATLEAERRRIDARFATDLTAHCAWPVPGTPAIEF